MSDLIYYPFSKPSFSFTLDRALEFASLLAITCLLNSQICFGDDQRTNAERVRIVLELRSGLSSGQTDTRRSAAYSLGELSEASAIAIPNLIDALKDDEVSQHAKDALIKIGPCCMQQLFRVFSDSNHLGQRREIIRVVSGIRPTSEVGAKFLGNLLKDANEEIRLTGAMGLWNYGSPSKVAIPELMNALGDSNSEVVEWSLTAIRFLNMEAAVAEEVVTEVLIREPTGKLGENAAEALGAMHASSSKAISALAVAVSKQNRSAASALGEIGSDAGDAVDELCVALASSERHLIIAASEALGKIRRQSFVAIPALAKIARERKGDDNSDEFISALKAIDEYGTDANPAIQDMLELLSDESDTKRFYAARILGNIGPPAELAVRKLEEVHAWDKDGLVRNECAHALKRIRPSGAKN